MRRYFLFIALVLLFFVSSAGTVNHFSGRSSLIAFQANEENCSASSLRYPHTELEISQHSTAVNSIGKSQDFGGFMNAAFAADFDGNRFSYTISDDWSNIACKNYLSHIYPSHNFW